KAAKACDAADVVDGLAVLQNLTLRLVAAAYGVSMSSVVHARRLTPEQRQAVKRSKRPLVLPRTPAAPPVPAIVPGSVPRVMEVEKLVAAAVGMVGVNGVLDLLAAKERIAA